jgi:hypothetical protein
MDEAFGSDWGSSRPRASRRPCSIHSGFSPGPEALRTALAFAMKASVSANLSPAASAWSFFYPHRDRRRRIGQLAGRGCVGC